jgi:hypothetical protein
MKHVKMLGLLVVAAASLLAFASSASATATLTSPAGTEYTGEIHATLEGSATLKAGITDTCTESTVKGKVETNNTTHAAGKISVLTWGKCTAHTTTTKLGSLTIKPNGDVFNIDTIVHVVETTAFGNITCNYGGGPAPGTKIGTLTAGTPATLDINTTSLPRQAGSSGLCAEKGTWTGNYTVTSPHALFLV